MQHSSDRDGAQVSWRQVALLGADYPGLRIHAEVAEGDAVRLGQVLFRDRKRPDIAFVAPAEGRVTAIRLGARRMFSSLVIERSGAVPSEHSASPPRADDRDSVRTALLEAGLWPSFIARPFGGVPDPDKQPDAIFVTATPGSSKAPDPHEVLRERSGVFDRGVDALTMLTDGMVHLCQDMGPDLVQTGSDRIRITKFRSKPGWGLPGTHVHRLAPVGPERMVWTIGYQDVAAIGHFLATGQYDPMRTIRVNTPHKNTTRTMRVPLGAGLHALIGDEDGASDEPRRLISGGLERGRTASFLARYHDEVTRTNLPVRSASNHTGPIIPHAALDRAMPLGLLAVPLMRALSVGDAETAQRFGCLELLEDDVAALTARCTSGTDYGRCLRTVLDQLRDMA